MKLSALKIRHNLKKACLVGRQGFTLIELLVVIGILGILAAALVATIDPFEQLNKAKDAKVENTLVEYQNGLLRYYTIKGKMPWSDPIDHCAGTAEVDSIPIGTLAVAAGSTLPVYDVCVDALVTQGELKQAFATSDALSSILIKSDTSNNVTMCYMPTSKAKKRDPNVKFDNTGEVDAGTGATACASAGGNNTSCYWCSK